MIFSLKFSVCSFYSHQPGHVTPGLSFPYLILFLLRLNSASYIIHIHGQNRNSVKSLYSGESPNYKKRPGLEFSIQAFSLNTRIIFVPLVILFYVRIKGLVSVGQRRHLAGSDKSSRGIDDIRDPANDSGTSQFNCCGP